MGRWCDRPHQNGQKGRPVRITAKTDYALKASAYLAAATPGALVKADEIARTQTVPLEFLENILRELRRAGLVEAQRGADGGYRLARAASEVAVADVVLAVDSPIVEPSPAAAGDGVGAVWRAVDGAVSSVLERVTLADVASGVLPGETLDPAGA